MLKQQKKLGMVSSKCSFPRRRIFFLSHGLRHPPWNNSTKHSAPNGNHVLEKLFVLIEHRMPPTLSFSCARTFGQMPKPSFWIWNKHPYFEDIQLCAPNSKSNIWLIPFNKERTKRVHCSLPKYFLVAKRFVVVDSPGRFRDDWYHIWLQKVMEYLYPHVLSHGEMDACCYTTQPHVHF